MATIGKFQNLDFEAGSNYWQLSQGNGSAAVVNTPANARTGNEYLKLVSGGTGGAYPTAMNTQDAAGASVLYMPVVPGQIIQYGGWSYRESGTGAGWIALVAYDQNKANPVYANVGTSATVGSWQFQQGTYKVPAGKYFLVFYLQVDPATASAQRFDDVFCCPALDVQTTSGGAVTDQTAYLSYQSLTMKFNTLDFQLVNPTVVPNLGDTITANDPNLALSWSGTIAKVQRTSVSERGGNTYVVISATNTNVAVASVAPFDLSDNSQPLRNWVLDGPMQDATLAALENSYVLGTPAEFSLDTTTFHDGTQSLKETTTRTASGWNSIVPNMPGGQTPTGAYASTGQVFAVAPGMTYSLSLWVKALAGSKQNHLKVLWFKDTASNLSDINSTTYVVGGTDGPFGWVQWTGTATAPQDARYAMIQVMAGYWDGVTGSNGQFWCQDLTWGGYARFREASHSYSKDQSGTNKTSSSYLTQQTGLWPIQTVAITNADLGLVNADYTVQDVAITWDIDHVTPWQRITVGDPIVNMSVWLNSTNAGILPITTTKISDGAVTTPKVAANAITAAQIAAGAITADKLTAVLVLASLIKAGTGVAHVEMDASGLRAYDGSGNLVVNIPTDGVSPVTINAQVVAKTLVVTGNSVFDGAKNEVALGATLQLDSSLQNPAQAPSIAQTWAGITLPINSSYDKSSTTYSRVGLDYDAAGGAGGTTKVFHQVTQNGGAGHDYYLELLASDRSVNRTIDLTAAGVSTPLSVCRLGSYVYILSIDGGTGSPTTWGSTVAATYSWNWSGANTDNIVATASAYTAPTSGTITSLTIRCAGYSGATTFEFAIWNSSGTLVAYSSGVTLGTTLGDQTIAISLPVTGGASYYFGFWRAGSGSSQWGVNSSGSFVYGTNVSAIPGHGTLSGCAGSGFTCGDIRAYVTYTPDTRVWKVRRYVQSTLALDTTYSSISQLASPTSPVLCQDGTNLYIVDRASGNNIKWQKYDGSLNTVGGLVDSGYNPGNSVIAAAAGNFDIGAWRMMVATVGNAIDSFDSTPTRQSASEGFSVPNGSAYGLTYGDALGTGARFWSLPATGGGAVNLTQHSTWTWTTASSVYWVAYTWYDSQAGHVHETMVSPYASITLSRRAQLVITTPSIPGTGGLDDPNNINYYALPNATQPATGAAKQQASQSATTLTMTGYNASGAADPSTNNFPAGTPGQITSEIGGLLIKGDGTAQFKNAMPYVTSGTGSYMPNGTSSTSGVHLGLGVGNGATGGAPHLVLTPTVTGRVRVRIGWNVSDGTSGMSTWAQIHYGTGSAPAYGAAATGTAIGPQRMSGFTNGTYTYAGSLEVEIEGLTLNTTYWFDLVCWVNGGTGTWNQISASAEEF